MWVVLDAGSMPEVVQGLTAWITTLASLAGSLAGAVAYFQHRRRKAMKRLEEQFASERPQPEPFQPSLGTGTLALQVGLVQAETALSEARRELAEMRRDLDQVSDDYRRVATALASAETKVAAAEAKIATLEDARQHWMAERERLIRESAQDRARSIELERQLNQSYAREKQLRAEMERLEGRKMVPSDTAITPLRPPKR